MRLKYSEVTFTVYEPDDEERGSDAYEQTSDQQNQLDEEHLERLQKLFEPYGMTVEKKDRDD